MTDPNGNTVTYAYDALNRQVDAYYPAVGSPYYETTHIQTVYDASGNVTSVTEDKTGQAGAVTDITTSTYDLFDRLETVTERGLTIGYAYDLSGNRTGVSTPSGTTVYTYDSRNRIASATTDGQASVYTYYPDGKAWTITYPNGTDVRYTYYPTRRVHTVVNRVIATGVVISGYTYAYDHNGNRTSQVEVQAGQTETSVYGYDELDRLVLYTVTGSTTTETVYTYEGYNRASETVTTDGALTGSRSYGYDDVNRLRGITDDTDPQNPSTITYTYDNNGNTVFKTHSSLTSEDIGYTYDARNQLVQAVRDPAGAGVVLGHYDYNASGLRVRHRHGERGDVDTYYDESAVIEERRAADNALVAHYRYAERLLSLDTGESIQYYHHDALGSTTNLSDEGGLVTVSYRLDPWGRIRFQAGESVNRQVFTGQEHDLNTGLIYFGARYYDPDTGRFITQDPYLGEGGTPPSLHRYLYAYSNPAVYVDLFGYSAEEARMYRDENLVYTPSLIEMSDRLGLDLPTEPVAAAAVAENVVTSLGIVIIETADGMRDFGRRVIEQNDQISRWYERHGRYARVIHQTIGKGIPVRHRELLSDPKFQEAFSDYAAIVPGAVYTQLEIPAKGIMGVLETEEGRAALKDWANQSFNFADESASFQERSIRAWRASIALLTLRGAGPKVAQQYAAESKYILLPQIENIKRIPSSQANKRFAYESAVAQGWKPPYPPNLWIRTFTTADDIKFVRVHVSKGKPQGSFLVREKEITHLGNDAEKIRVHLGLKDKPGFMSDVIVPKGTKMQVGRIGEQSNFGLLTNSGFQYELLQQIPKSCFQNTRPLQ